MPLTETLLDTFDDNAVDTTKWPSNYNTGAGGVPTETGGRARVVCGTGFSAYASDTAYTLQDSHAWVRLFPPAAGGAASEAWGQLLIASSTSGTDVIFEVNAVTGLLTMAVRVGFFDAGAVSISYDATNHAWLRIRESGGSLLWDTSADGLTWTNRRTAVSPAWVADADLEMQLIAHRDSGTPDVAEFDSFNATPSSAVFADLTDDFDDNTVDTVKWPDNYNTGPGGPPTETGGRARVPADEGTAAYASAPIYRLQDSHTFAQVFPPPATGMTEAYAQLLVLSDVPGTQIVFEANTATNLLLMTVHVGFVDDGGASIPYDPAEHAWLRIREDAGTLFWETASDGREWTARHSGTSPAWVSDNDLQVQLLAHSSPAVTGTPTGEYAEFDSFNVQPTLDDGYTVAIDWNGDGKYDGPYENVTDDVLARGAVQFQYGRDQARALSPPRVGSIAFTLCNGDRIFSPENPDSPISNDISPAAPISVSEVIDDTLYPLITGRIDTFDVKTDRGDRSAVVTGLDGLALLRGVKISTELYAAQRTGALIAVILDAVGWTGPRDLDVGATHVPWWWAQQDDAFNLLTGLLASEGPPAIAYVSPDGTFIYRDRHHRLLRYPSLVSQATFIAPKETCLTAQAIPGPPELLQVSDTAGVLATLTVGAKTVAMRGPSRTFTENKKPFTDSFDRTVASGFGSSGGGGNYSVTGTASDFSVNGSVGIASLPTANSSRFATILDDMTDVDATATVTLPTAPAGASSSVGLVFNYTDVDNNNRARLIVTTAGAVQLTLEKEVADAVTTLGAATQVGTGFVGGDLWHIRAQRTGTTIRCRAWKDGTEEPTTWLHSVTDTSNSVGRVGFRFLASTGSTSLPRLFHTHSIQVHSGTWPTIPTVTHNTWVRLLDEPFDGRWTNQIADQILRWSIDPSPDVLAYAMKYINGAPAVVDPTLGAQVTGQANYGPLAADGSRVEGADFHDYMGLDWVFPNGEARTADADQLTSLDCSGFVRMVYGFQMGLPMVFDEDIDGINLPRRTLDIGPSGPGVIVAQAVGTPPSLANLQIGDVPHFDATSDGETAGQVDHNGIYIGTDQSGNMRFVNSRKTPNGPTFGDLGGASVLNGSGTYTTRLRIIRRF